MERHAVRLALAAILLLAGGLVWRTFASTPEVTREDGPRERPGTARDAAPPEAVQLEGHGATGTVPEAPVPEPETPEDDVPLAPADGPVRLVVRLVGDGPRPALIELTPHAEGPGFPVRLRLAGGVLEGRLPGTQKFQWIGVKIDGWPSDEPFRDVVVPESRIVTLDVTLPRRVTLLVADATTGAPLPGARAVPESRMVSLEYGVSPPTRFRRREASLPADSDGRIVLPPSAVGRDWWVGAPDHAWATRRVGTHAAEVRVALGAGGSILAEIEGWAELRSRNPRVVATRPRPVDTDGNGARPRLPDGVRDTWEQLRDVDMLPAGPTGAFELSGLPPGSYKVVVGHPTGIYLQEVWGEAAVEVEAGRAARVRVATRLPTEPDLVAVDLELIVPPDWGQEAVMARVRGEGVRPGDVGGDVEFGPDPSSWRRRIGDLVPGAYEVTTSLANWSFPLRVRRDAPLVRVAVPGPALLRVRVLEAEGPSTIEGATVKVRYPDPRTGAPEQGGPPPPEAPDWSDLRAWSGGYVVLHRGTEEGDFVGRVVSGDVWIHVDAPGCCDRGVRTTLSPGASAAPVEVRLPRAGRVNVRVLRGGVVAKDAKGDVTCGVDRPDADVGDSVEWLQPLWNGEALFEELPAGTCVVTWNPQDGTTPARQELIVRPGETVNVDFPAK